MPLSQQPLVLPLGQVRFSPVRQMADYIPAIREEFRRHGFPLERAGKIQQLIFGPGDGVPAQVVEQQRWEYRTKDETWSVLVMQDSVVLQTTSYERFEGFAEKLLHAVRTVLAKTEHDQLGVVQRVGLRSVDVVQPREGEDFRFYLRPGFHGVADEVFKAGTHRLHVESTGKTSVGDIDGTMVVRVVQNDQGFSLPPDLLGAAPKHTPRAQSGELITLVDMDHYIEGTFDPSADWIVARAYEMHDHLVETLEAWLAVLKPAGSGSSGVVALVTDYGPILPHIGSSSFVVDRRPARVRAENLVRSEVLDDFRSMIALPVVEQMQELLAALSINKSQLAEILRVTRPTMYDWFQGKEPNAANADRLRALLRILARASVCGATPLNARFVRKPMELDAPSIIDLLAAEDLDEDRIVRALQQARALGETSESRRTCREDRLRALGFEDPMDDERRERLARNAALKDWPER